MFFSLRCKFKSIESVEFQHSCRHLCSYPQRYIQHTNTPRRWREKKTNLVTRVLFGIPWHFSLSLSFLLRVCTLFCQPSSSYLEISFFFIVANPNGFYIDTNVFVPCSTRKCVLFTHRITNRLKYSMLFIIQWWKGRFVTFILFSRVHFFSRLRFDFFRLDFFRRSNGC